MHDAPTRKVSLQTLVDDRRGAVFVEFVLMTALGLLVAGVLAAGATLLVGRFESVNRTLYSGTP